MPWLRLWVDILDDPDLHDLPKSTCWGWVLMLAVAKKTENDGTLPPLKRLAYMMHQPQEMVASWLDELVTAGLIERNTVTKSNAVTYSVHGWDRWQEPKDHTNAARQAKFKAKNRPPLHPPEEIQIQSERQSVPAHARPDNVVTHSVIAEVTPLPITTQTHTHTIFHPDCEECKRNECVRLAGERWGACNGDVVVGDLLKTFPAQVVMESMDATFDRFNGRLETAYLRKCCEGKYRVHTGKNGKLQ